MSIDVSHIKKKTDTTNDFVKYKLEDMIKGWFIGNFEPSLYKTDETFKIDSIMIRDSLEESLNQNNTIKKIKYVIDAYRILIYIVEDIRKEKYVPGPPDDSFLDEFERPYKRSKKDT